MARRDRNAARTGWSLSRRCGTSSTDAGLPGGPPVLLAGDQERCHARHSGLVRYLARVFENEATVGRDLGGDLSVDKRRIDAKWGMAAAARAGLGTARGPGWRGQAVADFVRNFSHPADACRSVGVERNRGSLLRSSSSHPLCPCGRRRHCSRGVPLVSGTSATRCASTRIVQPSLRIGASRWVTRGRPDSRSGCVSQDVAERSPLATAPVGSAGVVLGSTRWTLPDDLHGGEAMSGLRIPASVRPDGQLLARIVDAPRTRGKRRLRVCVARVSRHLCANRGKASPHAGKGVRQDPSPAWGRDPAREAVVARQSG